MVSIGGWVETVALSLVFITIFGGVVISNMNLMYDKNYDVGIRDNNNSSQLFVQYQDTAQEKITGGEVNFNSASGITLKTSWELVTDLLTAVWSFITGGWIAQIINSMNLGAAGSVLAITLQLLYFISLVFAALYALFKVSL